MKRCGYETKQWIIPAGTKVVSQKNIYLYRYLSQSAVAGTININGFSKGVQSTPDVNPYTTETDGSRLYDNPRKNGNPITAKQKKAISSADAFCREQ